MKFLGTKRDGKFSCPPAIAEAKRKHWNSVKDGATVELSLTVPRQSKSNSQLGAVRDSSLDFSKSKI